MNEEKYLTASDAEEPSAVTEESFGEEDLAPNVVEQTPAAKMEETAPPPQTEGKLRLAMRKKWAQFAAGFFGWYIILGVI